MSKEEEKKLIIELLGKIAPEEKWQLLYPKEDEIRYSNNPYIEGWHNGYNVCFDQMYSDLSSFKQSLKEEIEKAIKEESKIVYPSVYKTGPGLRKALQLIDSVKPKE